MRAQLELPSQKWSHTQGPVGSWVPAGSSCSPESCGASWGCHGKLLQLAMVQLHSSEAAAWAALVLQGPLCSWARFVGGVQGCFSVLRGCERGPFLYSCIYSHK